MLDACKLDLRDCPKSAKNGRSVPAVSQKALSLKEGDAK